MTKEEYLKILQNELSALPHEEQTEAMDYYRSYFEDAGDEKTASVMEELGPPEKLGEYIRSNFSCVPGKITNERNKSENTARQNGNTTQEPKGKNGVNMLLLILLITLTFPLWGSLTAGLLAAIFGIIVAVIASGFAGLIAAAVLFLAGIVVAAVGISLLFSIPLSGLLGLGSGLFLLGSALLLGILFAWLGIKIVPLIIRSIVKICSLPFKNGKAQKHNKQEII